MVNNKKSNVFGIISLISGILGIVFFFMSTVGLIFSALAIIFYNLQKKRFPNKIATAGLIIGLISLVINLVLFILAMFFYGGVYTG